MHIRLKKTGTNRKIIYTSSTEFSITSLEEIDLTAGQFFNVNVLKNFMNEVLTEFDTCSVSVQGFADENGVDFTDGVIVELVEPNMSEEQEALDKAAPLYITDADFTGYLTYVGDDASDAINEILSI